MAWDLQKQISSNHGHQWNKARRRHWILTCASPQEFFHASDAGATGLFFGYFKTFMTVAPASAKKTWMFQHRTSGVLS
jgi:hypothetical protein